MRSTVRVSSVHTIRSSPSPLTQKYPYTSCGTRKPLALADESCSRRIGRMRSLKSASASPGFGRYCHWLRNNAVSLMYSAISSMPMPFITFEPRNGGTNTVLSVSISGERRGMVLGSTSTFSARGIRRSDNLRPKSGSSTPDFLMLMILSRVARPSNASLPYSTRPS